jgi:hypothetical protein
MLDRRSPWPRGCRSVSRRLSFWGRLAALGVLEAAAAEAQLRFGNEFQVNVYTNYSHLLLR